jgi:hypothetical protein
MRQASRGQFERHYTEQKNYETLTEIYSEVLNDRSARST